MCVLYASWRALRQRFSAARPPSPRDLSRWELTHPFGLTRIAVIDAVISEVQSSVENEPMQVLFFKVPDTRYPSRFSPCSPFCLLHHCFLIALFQGVPSDLALPFNFLLQPILTFSPLLLLLLFSGGTGSGKHVCRCSLGYSSHPAEWAQSRRHLIVLGVRQTFGSSVRIVGRVLVTMRAGTDTYECTSSIDMLVCS
jgi:hypothetical protein